MNHQIPSDVKIPEELQVQKDALANGDKPRATVRELLGWFGAARRGLHVVNRIRTALDDLDLLTWPDFEGEYIDQVVYFMDKKVFQPPKTPTTRTESGGAAPGTSTEAAAPSHRLGRLKAANNKPVFVTPNDRLEVATTLMLSNDFSQLPIMQGERTVKGMVSWKSIGSRLALQNRCDGVQDCLEPHHELSEDASLYDAVSIIALHDCVLVRNRENVITGLVTGADISEQFQLLAEPFLLLGDIENSIRTLIEPRFALADLAAAKDPADTDRVIEGVADLTFGEYIRLFENGERWQKFGLAIDRVKFTDQLKRIRDIRNDVMHFDPDGISETDIADLRRFSRFLDQLQQLAK